MEIFFKKILQSINGIKNILSFPSIVLLISVFIILIILLLHCLITIFLMFLKVSVLPGHFFSFLSQWNLSYNYCTSIERKNIFKKLSYIAHFFLNANIFNSVFWVSGEECKRDCRKHCLWRNFLFWFHSLKIRFFLGFYTIWKLTSPEIWRH